MTQSGEMHANLVGASRVELHLDQSGAIDVREFAPVRARFASIAEDDAAAGGHARAALGGAHDSKLHAAIFFLEEDLLQGGIGLLVLALAKSLHADDVVVVVQDG